jgi:hypothetical protein
MISKRAITSCSATRCWSITALTRAMASSNGEFGSSRDDRLWGTTPAARLALRLLVTLVPRACPAVGPGVPAGITNRRPSTTVVIMRQELDDASDSDNVWPGADARGASGTRPGSDGPSVAPRGPRARGGGESPERSAGRQATPGFERGQAAPRLRGWQAFF